MNTMLSIEERKEWVESIAADLKAKGFRVWKLKSGLGIRINSYRNDVLMAIEEMPESWVQWNMSYSRGGANEFKTVIKPY